MILSLQKLKDSTFLFSLYQTALNFFVLEVILKRSEKSFHQLLNQETGYIYSYTLHTLITVSSSLISPALAPPEQKYRTMIRREIEELAAAGGNLTTGGGDIGAAGGNPTGNADHVSLNVGPMVDGNVAASKGFHVDLDWVTAGFFTWHVLVFCLLLYTAVVTPLRVGSLLYHSNFFFAMDILVDVYFGFDTLAVFGLYIGLRIVFLAYLHDLYVETGWKKDCLWLALYILGELPTLMPLHIFKAFPTWLLLFKLLRLFRFRRFPLVNVSEEESVDLHYLMRLLRLMAVALFVIHLGACLFFYIAVDTPSKNWIGTGNEHYQVEGLWYCYVTSFYWATTTFTTTGYGDFHAKTWKEMRFSIIYMATCFALMNEVRPLYHAWRARKDN